MLRAKINIELQLEGKWNKSGCYGLQSDGFLIFFCLYITYKPSLFMDHLNSLKLNVRCSEEWTDNQFNALKCSSRTYNTYTNYIFRFFGNSTY